MSKLATRVQRALEQELTNIIMSGDISHFDAVCDAQLAVRDWIDSPVYALAPHPPKLEPVPDPYEIWCKEVWGVDYELEKA